MPAVEAEAEREHAPHARVQLVERSRELPPPRLLGRLVVRRERVDVLDESAVQAFAVADGSVEADRDLDELEQLAHPLLGLLRLVRELGERRLVVELLRQLTAGAQQT